MMIKLKSLISEGHYPVVVGIITMDGRIMSQETHKTHGDLNFKRGICWRYNPNKKTTYWHGDESEHDETDEINVDAHLYKKYGYTVERNVILGGNDAIDNIDLYNQHHDDAHGIYGLNESSNGTLTIYQGRNVYNRGSKYFTVEKAWAQQFTQSGQEKEITVAKIDPKVIYEEKPLPQATNEFMVEKTVEVAKAKNLGYKAIWVDEGIREPRSIFVMDMTAVKIVKPSVIKESVDATKLRDETEDFRQSLLKKYPQLQELYFGVQVGQVLHISSIKVKLEDRHQGVGKNVIRDIKKFADDHDLVITLAPEPERGYKDKLDRFYKDLGFINNRGRKKDYRYASFFGRTMYRKPKINEGAILLHKEDKKEIYKYLDEMDKYSQSIFKHTDKFGYEKNRFVDSEEVINLLQTKSDELSKKFNFKIQYYFKNKSATKGYYDEIKNVIGINLFLHSDIAIFRNGIHRIFKISNLNFKSIKLTFFHEFVHYIQTTLRKEKTGNIYTVPSDWSNKDKYMKRPWEQQAHAIAYLEKLKQDLNTKNPKSILLKLKKIGLLKQDALNNLKTSDYKSWKAIMKQIIMALTADIKEKK